MKTFNDLFNMCEAIENDGIMDAQVDDIVEIVSFATFYGLWKLMRTKILLMQ